jgi:hypothetical protein
MNPFLAGCASNLTGCHPSAPLHSHVHVSAAGGILAVLFIAAVWWLHRKRT